ncbi:MAG: putative motility protein [Ectothiorhodospiraceae bacterium]|nr:putative motility protein [Ectothiorhodospiraceae bacterium]
MDISGASSVSAGQPTTIAIEVQKTAQDVQKQTAETLLEALPDPSSPLGQNLNVNA